MKVEKIKIFINEAMKMAPDFRKSLSPQQFSDKLKLTPHQYYSLLLISKYESLSMSELAEKLGVSNQQITRVMDGLVKAELTDRFTDPNNRRVVKTKINENGRKLILKYREALMEKKINDLSVLSEEEINEAIVHIKALNRILSKV